LQELMEGVYWYDYILQNTDKTHQAKIQYRDKTFIMTVTASNIMQAHQESGLVSILMADVTEQELYKKELEHITIHDELTGLRNRHYFNQRIDEEIQRSQRYQNPLSLISFDIDHFKQVNDTYGHDVGDLVLKKVSRECLPYIRETDALCRVGGEEFMVIMPETKLEDAVAIAERLRMAIQNMSLSNLELPVTISLGVVELSHVENFALLYKRADQALYAAKDQGRNCVVVG
jgi:diguanylate cyclase